MADDSAATVAATSDDGTDGATDTTSDTPHGEEIDWSDEDEAAANAAWASLDAGA